MPAYRSRDGGFTFAETLITIALAGIVVGSLYIAVFQASRNSGSILTGFLQAYRMNLVDATFREEIRKIRPPYWATDTIAEATPYSIVAKYARFPNDSIDTGNTRDKTLRIEIRSTPNRSVIHFSTSTYTRTRILPFSRCELSVIEDSVGIARGISLILTERNDSVRIDELFGAQPIIGLYD